MVWGCHANQFADGPTSLASFDSSEAVGEQWLLMDNRGSIGSVGSTAYEYLHTNSAYNLLVAEAFYTRPPAVPISPGGPLRSRWILGEVFGLATIRNGMTSDTQQMIMNWTVNMLGDPMLRMDALPPRVYDVRLNGTTVADNAPLSSDSPTDSVALVARVREETAIQTVSLAERDLVSGTVTPIDSTGYTVAFTDSGRIATLTGKVRPRNENYDVQVRATDTNGRLQVFTLQVRVVIRYLADGVDIVDGVFVSNGAMLRAEVTTPIPVSADSLQLLVNGMPIVVTKEGAGRNWVLEGIGPGTGTHTLQVAVGGRTAGFDPVTFQVTEEFADARRRRREPADPGLRLRRIGLPVRAERARGPGRASSHDGGGASRRLAAAHGDRRIQRVLLGWPRLPGPRHGHGRLPLSPPRHRRHGHGWSRTTAG